MNHARFANSGPALSGLGGVPVPGTEGYRPRMPWQPAGNDPDAIRSSRPAAGGSADQVGSARDPVRVLVVDDQPDVLATTAELFRIMGYEVHSANNGAEALAILKVTPDIQVLFSDVVMPGMSGVALGIEARRLLPEIHVILASGFHASAGGQLGAEVNDFHFLPKPFRMSDVARVLRK
jgi:CheY-like chemotaxis protein